MSEDRIEALKQLLEQEPHDTMLLFGLGNEFLVWGNTLRLFPTLRKLSGSTQNTRRSTCTWHGPMRRATSQTWSARPWNVVGGQPYAAATGTLLPKLKTFASVYRTPQIRSTTRACQEPY